LIFNSFARKRHDHHEISGKIQFSASARGENYNKIKNGHGGDQGQDTNDKRKQILTLTEKAHNNYQFLRKYWTSRITDP